MIVSKKISNIRIPVEDDKNLKKFVASHINCEETSISDIYIIKKSLDARKKPRLFYVYTVNVVFNSLLNSNQNSDHYQINNDNKQEAQEVNTETKYNQIEPIETKWDYPQPVIIGAGPAGLFAALYLVDSNIPCTIIERGEDIHKRTVDINMFWKTGLLNTESNVCFGAGGAGLFSDGKLITRIKSPFIPYVLKRLTDFGAPKEIQYLYNPHVGSDKIRRVIKAIIAYLKQKGCNILFNSNVYSLKINSERSVQGVLIRQKKEDAQGNFKEKEKLIETNHVILATGHSAKDVYSFLDNQNVDLIAKSYAIGVRVEHPQDWINKLQLGITQSDNLYDDIGSAQYRLTYNAKNAKTNNSGNTNNTDTSVYSFCMCPGGYILSSGTDSNGIVTNGMSNYKRNSKWANAAFVTPVNVDKLSGDNFRGLKLQYELEQIFYQAVKNKSGTSHLPAQRLKDFLTGKVSTVLPSISSPSKATSVNIRELFPSWIEEQLLVAFEHFAKKIPWFNHDDAMIFGVESRTSSPIRIPRDNNTLESTNTTGLYPVGEGAGYAGGITSAAVDGIKAVTKMIDKYVY